MRLSRRVTANHITLEEYKFTREILMQSFLIENEQVLSIDIDPFTSPKVREEELPVIRESNISKSGRADLFIEYADSNAFGIAELKKQSLNEKHLEQLEAYLSKENQSTIASKLEIPENEIENLQWLGILVGTDIDQELAEKLSKGHLSDGVPMAAIVLNRYKNAQNSEIFVTSDFYFKRPKTKDYTQYKFQGIVYGKARLVQAVIKAVVEQNKSISFDELRKMFPDNLQGSYGVFTILDEAISTNKRLRYTRYYTKPNDVIILLDETEVSISNQWGIGNIENFVQAAQKLKFKIEEIK